MSEHPWVKRLQLRQDLNMILTPFKSRENFKSRALRETGLFDQITSGMPLEQRRSEWQILAYSIRTRTSEASGGSTSISSTFHWSGPRHTNAAKTHMHIHTMKIIIHSIAWLSWLITSIRTVDLCMCWIMTNAGSIYLPLHVMTEGELELLLILIFFLVLAWQ